MSAEVKHGWMEVKRSDDSYKEIADYGIIGDTRTCALVGVDGSIDWMCLPRFDSPSVFASILDVRKGGRFRIAPAENTFRARQYYLGLTNVLVTEFRGSGYWLRLTDFMPCASTSGKIASSGEIHRIAESRKGKVKLGVDLSPRPGYAEAIPLVSRVDEIGYTFTPPDPSIRQETALITDLEFKIADGGVSGLFTLGEGKKLTFVFRYGGLRPHHSADPYTDAKLKETVSFWKKWVSQCTYNGRWREQVLRSALVLKLLVYSPTGAVVAAPTTSLPEHVGGVRNWDYRYSWIRDSSFVLWAFKSLGHVKEVENYIEWLESVFHLTGGSLQVMLGLGGEKDLSEQILPHLSGYKNSSPVRVGNGAWTQFQLDVYGILLDALYFSHKHGSHAGRGGITKEVFNHFVEPLVNSLKEDWKKPDCGIWEVRGNREHFVYSKMWCWVAFDRAVKLAEALNFTRRAEEWRELRDEVKKDIFEHGWNPDVKAFTRSYGSRDLDSANLLMPQVRFISGSNPYMVSTLEKTVKELMVGEDLLLRYKSEDGLPGQEGAFLMCSFWLTNCLALAGKTREAAKLLDRLVKKSNHLGLYSEEIDPETGRFLGNFPQAFTHMGLITAAVSLDRALNHAA
ncbi:MAG: glycoside hydrolase family 15 protein [Thermoprotei archaeon]